MRQHVWDLLRVVACTAVLQACGGETPEVTDRADSLDVEDQAEAPLVMPEYPEPLDGRLVTRSAGFEEIAGEWRARAGRCEETGTLQVVASREGTGTILLFYLPPEGEEVSIYPVVAVDSTTPQPPAVRVGVQRLRSRIGDSFQASEGTVELTLRNRRASGRFALPLVNIETEDTVLYAGVFSEVRVRRWSFPECGVPEQPDEPADTLADSAAAADSLADSVAADSAAGAAPADTAPAAASLAHSAPADSLD